MGHLLGYAHVSTTDQHPQRQIDALQRAGCYRAFTETTSGTRTDRPTLELVLDQLRPGNTLVVWQLDRLGRSLRHLVDTITSLADRGVGFRSLQEAIDTTTPGGKLVFQCTVATIATTLGVSRAFCLPPPQRRRRLSPCLSLTGVPATLTSARIQRSIYQSAQPADCHAARRSWPWRCEAWLLADCWQVGKT